MDGNDNATLIYAGTGIAAPAAIVSWIDVMGQLIQVLGSGAALVASIVSIIVFLRNSKKVTNAKIQSEIKGPVGDLRSEVTVDPERSN